jgi:nucleotide-binding universal stress UspA family protein
VGAAGRAVRARPVQRHAGLEPHTGRGARGCRARARGRLLAEGVALANEAGFDATGRLEESGGSPWRTLLDVADELDASLIVLGTHGVSGVRAVLGSVSTAVTHHAKRPLLLVPAADVS